MILSYKNDNICNNATYLKSYETKLYRKDSIVYSKGEKINFIYIILNGEIKSILEENKVLNSNINLKKGSTLGLIDFMLNRNYSKTMLAKKTSVLALVKKEYLFSDKSLLTPSVDNIISLKAMSGEKCFNVSKPTSDS